MVMHTDTDYAHDIDVRAALSRDHTRLERLFEELEAAFHADSPQDCAALWTRFDAELRRHFDVEERHILPLFKRHHPQEAAAIVREHAEILAKLERLGIGVDLHMTRADAVDEFVLAIRDHAAREDHLMYAWTQARLVQPEHAGWRAQIVAATRALTQERASHS
jgi:hemerythrin-like domain-containing protein